VRATIDEASLKAHPHMALYPGMPAEIVVKRRPRRAIDYIIEPLAQTFSHAFHEE
jgi:HlyD family secretion protein